MTGVSRATKMGLGARASVVKFLARTEFTHLVVTLVLSSPPTVAAFDPICGGSAIAAGDFHSLAVAGNPTATLASWGENGGGTLTPGP